MAKRVVQALAESLEALKAGRLSIEGCLNRYPRHRAELEPLLRMALQLQRVRTPSPSYSFRQSLRARLMAQYAASMVPDRAAPRRRWARKAAAVAVLCLAVMAVAWSGVQAVHAAEDVLPGHPLYPVKTTLEELRLLTSLDRAHDVELHLSFAQQRLQEMQSLIGQGQVQDTSQAADSYADHVHRATQDLSSVAVERPSDATDLTRKVREALIQQTASVDNFAAEAPVEVSDSLHQTLHAALHQTMLIDQWLEDQSDSGSAGKPFPNLTLLPDELNEKTEPPPKWTPTPHPSQSPPLTPTPDNPAGSLTTPVILQTPTILQSLIPPITPSATSLPTQATAASTCTLSLTATPPGAQEERFLFVVDLDSSSAYAEDHTWHGTVTIAIQDQDQRPVSGAVVTTWWFNQLDFLHQCTTDETGLCSLTKGGYTHEVAYEWVVILDVFHPAFTYQQTSNIDPDGDSDGTFITISPPPTVP